MVQEILPRKAGLDRVLDHIHQLISEKEEHESVIVLITGGSGSGKTRAIMQFIREAFPDDTATLSVDSYYRGMAFMIREAKRGITLNFDQPEAIDMEGVREDLIAYRNGRAVRKRQYDFTTGTASLTEATIPRKKILIVEGLFALRDEIRELGDLRVFVSISTHGQLIRRLIRDMIERKSMPPHGMLRYFAETVVPMHQQYVESTKKAADIIINNEYDAAEESGRAPGHEQQVKYPLRNDPKDILPSIGAEPLARSEQIDYYFDPPDRPLAHTGESLRIREETGLITFCYKGPKTGSAAKIRERPKLEFEIDAKTEQEFLKIYGRRFRTIRKIRSLYRLGVLVFSIDNVVSLAENGREQPLGQFLEFRLSGFDKTHEREELERIVDAFGIDPRNATTDAYVEMS